MYVEQVLAHTLVLARVACAHASSPAAKLWPGVTVYPLESLLLRSGEGHCCVMVEREREASNLHRPHTARKLPRSVRAWTSKEDVCALPQEIQASCWCFGQARLLLASIHSHDPPGGEECLVLHAELHSVPLSVTDQSLGLKPDLISPNLELHNQMGVQEGDGEVV